MTQARGKRWAVIPRVVQYLVLRGNSMQAEVDSCSSNTLTCWFNNMCDKEKSLLSAYVSFFIQTVCVLELPIISLV